MTSADNETYIFFSFYYVCYIAYFLEGTYCVDCAKTVSLHQGRTPAAQWERKNINKHSFQRFLKITLLIFAVKNGFVGQQELRFVNSLFKKSKPLLSGFPMTLN